MSRTPVRGALARQASDDLIERGGGGFCVPIPSPSLTRLKDYYELRITLELRGIARAVEGPSVHHDPTVTEAGPHRWYAMREQPQTPDPRFVVQDERCHTELSRGAGNPALTPALVAPGERGRRVRTYGFLTRGRLATNVTEHIQITGFVRAGRLDATHHARHARVGASMAVVLERARHAMTQTALHADNF
ncbi:FCD domain-containing protein [Streptomyces sp. QTS52]